MGAAQAAHAAPASAVPQLEQKRPEAAAPQEGQEAGAGAGVVTPEDNGVAPRSTDRPPNPRSIDSDPAPDDH
jgi:hypothetical protein